MAGASAGSALKGATTSRILNSLAYAFANRASDVTTAATGDLIPIIDISADYAVKFADAANVAEMISGQSLTATITGNVTGNVTGAINPSVALTKGAGVAGMETYVSSVGTVGTLKTTRILIDLTGLVGSATDVDIIGDSAAASAHMGQITAAINGTIVGGQVTCLEVPAGGTADINFYSANESTGAQDALASSLTETVLIDAGGSWTSGASKGMTALPPANDYLYVANGAASGGTFTAGKFLIELFGT